MIKIILNGKQVFAEKNTLLSDVLSENGVFVAHPCGRKGVCKKCSVLVNGKEELACKYKITSDITVEAIGVEKIKNADEFSGKNALGEFFLALDIGTTTLALALVSKTGERAIRARTAVNSQVSFGADVISRIEYSKNNSVNELQKVLINDINALISAINAPYTETLYVVGNTVMLHTLFGEDCSSLGSFPYTPRFLAQKYVLAESLGIKGVKNIVSLPCVSAFVGADIVSGINCVALPKDNKYNLLIDLGTNAEVVLFSKTSAIVSAAAAGPCFEGANISCGMSATAGAIYSYSQGNIKTVENKKPKGICGTGLIDIIAELLKNGIIEENGYMQEDFFITEDVYLSCNDIREYQLAKSAIYSAVLSLMEIARIDYGKIDTVYLTGGFSAEINIENAIKTGLLAKELKGKYVALNNASLQGAILYGCSINNFSAFIKYAKYVDLSQNKSFAKHFLENIEF